VSVGPAERVARDVPAGAVRDMGTAVLLPGLVDAHCHLEWSLLDGLIAGDTFAVWMTELLRRTRDRDPQRQLAAARYGALRALEAGTTTLADNGPTGAGALAMRELGLGGVCHVEVFGTSPSTADARERRRNLLATIERVGNAGGPRIGISPHAPYTVGPRLWSVLAEDQSLAHLPWATHLAESPDEDVFMRTGAGALVDAYRTIGVSPARWPGAGGSVARLAEGGALRPGMVAAHCVQIDRQDARRLAAARVAVAHCPIANSALSCGRMPVEHLREEGVTLAMGSDSPASGGCYDLRAEARGARRAHAEAGVAVEAREMVEWLTRGGALALGRADRVGALAEGMDADLLALMPEQPGDDPFELALASRSRVMTVVRGGRLLVERGRAIGPSASEIRDLSRGIRGSPC
jgi:cytosine/adenosine deaminase-related metal-dependent hydrolase